MRPEDVALRIEMTRKRRVREERKTAAADLFAAQAATLKRDQKRIGNAADAWSRLCPAELRLRTTVLGVTRGVLRIGASDSAARFEIDRWLRAGGSDEVVRRCRTTVRSVKVVFESAAIDP